LLLWLIETDVFQLPQLHKHFNVVRKQKKIFKVRLIWDISNDDIESVKQFIQQHDNAFVKRRIDRNVNKQNLHLNKDNVLKAMVMCLLTSRQASGPNSPVGNFLRLKPFPITFEAVIGNDERDFFRAILLENGLKRYINRIHEFFLNNFETLEKKQWKLLADLISFESTTTKKEERKFADELETDFKGFGPKQARNFLQSLGLTKYELPIDSRITNWLNKFGFPVRLTSGALGDKNYYHFVSDGIQLLCQKAEVYPCVLDAAIFSSVDNGAWTEENVID
jgi:thermostable 8-oxoguanine DNA glycosylase